MSSIALLSHRTRLIFLTLMKKWQFFTIAIIIIVLMFCSQSKSFNFLIQSIQLTNRPSSKLLYQNAFIDSSGNLQSILSPGLQWCSTNPFLKPYNQSVVLQLELYWIQWKRQQLRIAYEILKNVAFQSGDWGGGMVHLAYPPAVPLPCPYPRNLTRVGGIHDGNKIICGIELLQNTSCTVYSLGSQGNFNFELDLLKNTSCEIHTYDCTSPPPGRPIPRVSYHQFCLGDVSRLQKFMYPFNNKKDEHIFNNASLFRRFNAMLKQNNHSEIHILKMDIEGGEYSVFIDLLEEASSKTLPYQISFESHYWLRDIYHAILHQKMFSRLWEAGYRIIQHELNPGEHTCAEWTLMRVFC